MSSIQETHIEGDPEALTELANFLRSTLAPAVSALSQDFATARRKSVDAWDGLAGMALRRRLTTAATAAEYFGDEAPKVVTWFEELAEALQAAQNSMEEARASAKAIDGELKAGVRLGAKLS